MSSKSYPLEVEELMDVDLGVIGWWSRGHHDMEDFTCLVNQVTGGGEEFPFRAIEPKEVQHQWWRVVPDPDYGSRYIRSRKPGKGAFPVTVFDGYDEKGRR